ncbi:MAG: hypothetical protein KGJ37_07880, partial [Verrucomicrobiota bacterium]|nr:hypothetical protein [Verrucomicrobiota bacterium]
GGLLVAASVIAAFLHASTVLIPGIAGGAAMFALGWLITYVEDLLQKTWFQFGLAAAVLLALGIGGWIVHRSYVARKKAAMDDKISNNTIGAVQDARNDDAKTGSKVFEALEPYLKEWHVDEKGRPDFDLKDEIENRLVAMNLKNPS